MMNTAQRKQIDEYLRNMGMWRVTEYIWRTLDGNKWAIDLSKFKAARYVRFEDSYIGEFGYAIYSVGNLLVLAYMYMDILKELANAISRDYNETKIMARRAVEIE